LHILLAVIQEDLFCPVFLLTSLLLRVGAGVVMEILQTELVEAAPAVIGRLLLKRLRLIPLTQLRLAAVALAQQFPKVAPEATQYLRLIPQPEVEVVAALAILLALMVVQEVAVVLLVD